VNVEQGKKTKKNKNEHVEQKRNKLTREMQITIDDEFCKCAEGQRIKEWALRQERNKISHRKLLIPSFLWVMLTSCNGDGGTATMNVRHKNTKTTQRSSCFDLDD
jgi:hypothetical protein